jgi:ATP-dependent Clp protease ATP-binding subunit ClpX
VLIDTMFDLPTWTVWQKVVIDEHIVEEGAKPLLVYANKRPAA